MSEGNLPAMKVTFGQWVGRWTKNCCLCPSMTVSSDGVDPMSLVMSIGQNVGDKTWFSSMEDAIRGQTGGTSNGVDFHVPIVGLRRPSAWGRRGFMLLEPASVDSWTKFGGAALGKGPPGLIPPTARPKGTGIINLDGP